MSESTNSSGNDSTSQGPTGDGTGASGYDDPTGTSWPSPYDSSPPAEDAEPAPGAYAAPRPESAQPQSQPPQPPAPQPQSQPMPPQPQSDPWATPPAGATDQAYGAPGYQTPPQPYGGQPYGDPNQPYGQPTPPYAGGYQQPQGAAYPPAYGPYGTPAYGQPSQTNGNAIAVTVVSGLSLVLCGGILCIPALVMGIMAITKQQTDPAGSSRMARNAWIAYVVGIVLSILVIVGIFAVAMATGEDFNNNTY
ncbi:hypothetical protein ACQP1U_15250 [Actinomycetota bacterium]